MSDLQDPNHFTLLLPLGNVKRLEQILAARGFFPTASASGRIGQAAVECQTLKPAIRQICAHSASVTG